MTATELANQTSNEAIQANLVLHSLRDQLLRMAPWDCALDTRNLVYITSTPGTPENTSAPTTTWAKGIPPPQWAYEYQYPVDCLRACWIIPSSQTGFSGIPITTAVTGGAPAFWAGPPINYKVQIDQFYPVTAAAPQAGGAGYVVGELVTLPQAAQGLAPLGAPAVIQVLTVDGAGAILTCAPVNQIAGSASPQGGSYFAKQTNPVAQASTTGVGVGATFNLTFGAQSSQRVILTNQEFAILVYVKQITDPNLMDPLFQDAWVQILGYYLGLALSGDKQLTTLCIQKANAMVMEARKADGNEGLSMNDITPDWIRTRGVAFTDGVSGPYAGFDWGPAWGSL